MITKEEAAAIPFLFRFLNLTRGTEFRVVDKATKLARSVPAVANTITAVFDPVPSNYWWEVEREMVQNTSVNVTPLDLYVGSPDIAGSWRDGVATGQKAVADNKSPILVGPGQVLTAIWTNANPGDVGWITIQIKILTRD